jgi:hypothetical protein
MPSYQPFTSSQTTSFSTMRKKQPNEWLDGATFAGFRMAWDMPNITLLAPIGQLFW